MMKIGDIVIISKSVSKIVDEKAEITEITYLSTFGKNQFFYRVRIIKSNITCNVFINHTDESIVLESIFLRNLREDKLNKLLNENICI